MGDFTSEVTVCTEGSVVSKLSRVSQISSASYVSSVLLEPPTLNDTIFARIALSFLFQNVTLLAIMANAAWIGADTEWNHTQLFRDDRLPLEPESMYIELSFCGFFIVELFIRFLAYVRKVSCIRDAWFLFDATLLVFMIAENAIGIVDVTAGGNSADSLGNMAVFKLLRLLRLTRLVRLMRFFPELMTLVKGMVRAMESVFFVLFFLMIIIFGTSIIFTSQIGKPPGERPPPTPDGEDPTALDMFGDIGSSMMTLLTNGVLADNLYQTLMAIKDESLILMWLFIVFVIVSGITLLNMLIGVLCRVVQDTARREGEKRKAFELKETFVKAFKAVDISNDGYIQEQEWGGIQNNPEVRNALLRLGIDETEVDMRLHQLRAKVFWDRPVTRHASRRPSAASATGTASLSRVTKTSSNGGLLEGLDFEDFVEQVSNLQWDRKASALDVETFRCRFEAETNVTKQKLDDVERVMQEVLQRRGLLDSISLNTPSSAASGFLRPSKPASPSSPPPPVAEPPALRPRLAEPPSPQPPESTPPPMAHASTMLPPLSAPPSLPPLLEGSTQTVGLPQHKALPPQPDRPPNAPPAQTELPPLAAWTSIGQISRHAAEVLASAPVSLPPAALGGGLSASKTAPPPPGLQKGDVQVPRDRLASVPTEVLLAAMKTRARRPRREAKEAVN